LNNCLKKLLKIKSFKDINLSIFTILNE